MEEYKRGFGHAYHKNGEPKTQEEKNKESNIYLTWIAIVVVSIPISLMTFALFVENGYSIF